MKKLILNNGITLILKENKNTPRIALSMNFALANQNKRAGVYSILNRLFFQGTKTKSAEQLATEIEENAIELTSDMKTDYIVFNALSLNEDFDLMLNMLQDIIFNSTLESFEKEKIKFKNEINSELDSPKTKAFDKFCRTMYENHPYGNCMTKVLENIDDIKIEEIKEAYDDFLTKSKITIAVVGEFNEKNIIEKLEKAFSKISSNNDLKDNIPDVSLSEDKIAIIEKEDANQAQILEGWLFPTYSTEEYPAVIILNSILGASGLSSRLFLELREKKGLAYTVRSIYETKKKCATLSFYIGTAPKNIQTSLDGFDVELNKIKTILVDDTELENAKNNVIGRRGFYTETNAYLASWCAFYENMGFGYDFEQKYEGLIRKVTKEDVKNVAEKFFNAPKVLTILAPKKYINIK